MSDLEKLLTCWDSLYLQVKNRCYVPPFIDIDALECYFWFKSRRDLDDCQPLLDGFMEDHPDVDIYVKWRK